ncbi:MAG: mechanosensitive ion channel family protein [Cyanobacteria bacterium P01_G01_bin.49]
MNFIDQHNNLSSWLSLKRSILIRFCILIFVTIIFTTIYVPKVVGQLPWIPSSGSPEIQIQTPWWDPNKAEVCGRLWCSQVNLFGGLDKRFTVALDPSTEENQVNATLAVEARARQVQNIYESIYNRVRQSEIMVEGNQIDSELWTKSNWKNLFFNRDSLGIHPATPRVEIGVKNAQTVIFVPEQPDLNLSGQTIVTINTADHLYQGKSIEEIAKEWRLMIFNSFNEALWAYEIDSHYSFARWAIAALIVGLVSIPIIVLEGLRSLLKSWYCYLNHQLRELKDALMVDAESLPSQSFSSLEQTETSNNLEKESLKELKSKKFFELVKKAIVQPKKALLKSKEFIEVTVNTISDTLHIPVISLRRQNIIKTRQNIALLLSGLLFWIQVSFLLLGISFVVVIFPETRRYFYFFVGQSVTFPLIWMLVGITGKVSNLLIDFKLNQWAKGQQVSHPNYNRYTLRVNTYSNALKGAVNFILIAVGVSSTIILLGIDITVLASVGGVAFVLAFLSRNVVEDMLNGALILFTDRYVIGDIIQVDNISGLVENMNIYTTQVRGSEGRLVTIPNSKISIVENLTKDWSRVEFQIKIAYDADIRKALDVINQVSKIMQDDPDWREKIIEPASILGVDNISYEGILIQVWIKTQAMQQWAVGREFRLRVKEAFEINSIKLGIPHQEILYRISSSNHPIINNPN